MIGGKVINDVFYENVSFRNYGCLVGMAVVSLEWQGTVQKLQLRKYTYSWYTSISVYHFDN